MKKCYYSGKTSLFGRSHTHHRGVAGGRWKKRAQKTARIFSPNLQNVVILEGGEIKRVKLATKVIKRVRKDIDEGKRPFIEIIKFMPRAKQEKVFNAVAKAAAPKVSSPKAALKA